MNGGFSSSKQWFIKLYKTENQKERWFSNKGNKLISFLREINTVLHIKHWNAFTWRPKIAQNLIKNQKIRKLTSSFFSQYLEEYI